MHKFNPRSIATYIVMFAVWVWGHMQPSMPVPAEIASALTGLLSEFISALIPDRVEAIDGNGSTEAKP